MSEKKDVRACLESALRIANGEERPELTCDFETDARYVYPKRINMIVAEIENALYLLSKEEKP